MIKQMIKEFVTYEQALALKELGFDEPCLAFYNGKFLDSTDYNFDDGTSKDIGYTEEQAYEIWKAGQEYWITSGKSITFEDLIEKFKPKAILQPNL
jgi:hypothetical protein